MSYSITLTDEEYAVLSAVAAKSGKTVDELAHEVLAQHMPAAAKPGMTDREFAEHLLRKGLILRIPDRQPDTPEEAAERQRLVNSLKPGKPLSEIIIEDRGPR